MNESVDIFGNKVVSIKPSLSKEKEKTLLMTTKTLWINLKQRKLQMIATLHLRFIIAF